MHPDLAETSKKHAVQVPGYEFPQIVINDRELQRSHDVNPTQAQEGCAHVVKNIDTKTLLTNILMKGKDYKFERIASYIDCKIFRHTFWSQFTLKNGTWVCDQKRGKRVNGEKANKREFVTAQPFSSRRDGRW
jgi:hypothetical protein